MKIVEAKTSGFCFGVRRAVDLALSLSGDTPTYTCGSLIHNRHVTLMLAQKGIEAISEEELDRLESGARVIIRAHGVTREVYEKLSEKGASVIDATCPYVANIHRIVGEEAASGRRVLIFGDSSHPEVRGIADRAGNCLIFNSPEQLSELLSDGVIKPEESISLVSQTTSDEIFFKKCAEILKMVCTNAVIFDTICKATSDRQNEAAEISALADVMVVIGDKESANTRRLFEICSRRCLRVFQIENADELEPDMLKNANVIGLTAGASTPGFIIEEVKTKMNEETKIVETGESFAEMLESTIKTLYTGDKVTGMVISITPTEIHVELGAKQAGYIPVGELSADPTAKPEDIVKVGQEIEAFVVRVNDLDGIIMLSKKKLDSIKGMEKVEAAVETGEVLEGVVTEENKGGLVVTVLGVRVFVPASLSGLPRGADLSSAIGKKVRLRITDVNKYKRRIVGNIAAVSSEERKAKAESLWSEIEPGKRYKGVVKSLTSYGAFVDVGGSDGMVHLTELTWGRIKHPSDVVKVGDIVDVYVISVDKEKKKISLGMKEASQNPWQLFLNKYKVGDVATVKIVNLMPFGAFAEIIPGVDGLVHISQIADRRIARPADVLSVDQLVDAKITDIDLEKKKISLSIRATLEGPDPDSEFVSGVGIENLAISEEDEVLDAEKKLAKAENAPQEDM